LQDRPQVQQVQIYTIPVLPKIKLPAPIVSPNLQLPTPLVITPKETSYYAEACEAHSSGFYSEDELSVLYPDLSQANSCDWAIYGFTVQGWFNVESKLALAGSYSQQLRDRITFLEGVIKDYESVSNKQQQAINKIGKRDND
jgi:hypothetical protein